MDKPNRVFLAWDDRQGRTATLAEQVGAQVVFVETFLPRRQLTLPFRHLLAAVKTVPLVTRRGLEAILVQQPPITLLALVVLVGRIRRIPVVADFHSATFEDRRWRIALKPTLALGRFCALGLVTNATHAARLDAAGIRPLVLHDPPEHVPAARAEPTRPEVVVVPVSWRVDEPITEILLAASTLPDLAFHITGSPTDVPDLPPNVTLTGYLSNADYDRELATAGLVVCLTRNANTMQRGGYEALAHRVPLVTTDSGVLRGFFGGAAEYADADAESIAAAISRAVGRRDDLVQQMTAVDAAHRRDFAVSLRSLEGALTQLR